MKMDLSDRFKLLGAANQLEDAAQVLEDYQSRLVETCGVHSPAIEEEILAITTMSETIQSIVRRLSN
jgi:hypothetical protein